MLCLSHHCHVLSASFFMAVLCGPEHYFAAGFFDLKLFAPWEEVSQRYRGHGGHWGHAHELRAAMWRSHFEVYLLQSF